MRNKVEIRESLPADITSFESLYSAAFPDEELLPLVQDLLSEGQNVLSLVAVHDQTLAGHIVFTICGVTGQTEKLALLGPLAVAPDRQRQGIGSALVREGLKCLKAKGIAQVHVLGDPAYYGRLNFRPNDKVMPPYRLPEEWRAAWQSIGLRDGTTEIQGTLSLPQPWQKPALWAP